MTKKQQIVAGVIVLLLAPALLVAGLIGGAIWPVHLGVDGYVPPFLGLLVALPFALISAITGVVFLVRGLRAN